MKNRNQYAIILVYILTMGNTTIAQNDRLKNVKVVPEIQRKKAEGKSKVQLKKIELRKDVINEDAIIRTPVSRLSQKGHEKVTFIFSKRGKYGLKSGSRVVVQPLFDTLTNIEGSNGLFIGEIDSPGRGLLSTLISAKGTILEPLSQHRIRYVDREQKHIAFQEHNFDENDGLVTIIMFNGQVVVRSQRISNWGLVRIDSSTGKFTHLLRISFDDKQCVQYINTITKLRTACYGFGDNVSKDGKIKVSLYKESIFRGENWGFIDEDGNGIIATEFDDAWQFYDNLCAVKRNNKWGYINQVGQLSIPFLYEEVNRFNEGVAWVKKDGKYGVINKAGIPIIPFRYNIEQYFDEEIFVNGRYCGVTLKKGDEDDFCIDKNGKIFWQSKDQD